LRQSARTCSCNGFLATSDVDILLPMLGPAECPVASISGVAVNTFLRTAWTVYVSLFRSRPNAAPPTEEGAVQPNPEPQPRPGTEPWKGLRCQQPESVSSLLCSPRSSSTYSGSSARTRYAILARHAFTAASCIYRLTSWLFCPSSHSGTIARAPARARYGTLQRSLATGMFDRGRSTHLWTCFSLLVFSFSQVPMPVPVPIPVPLPVPQPVPGTEPWKVRYRRR
jgi:hypothetical protein